MSLDERACTRLRATTRFGDIRFVPMIDSTNRALMDLASGGAGEGTVLYTDHQTAGRGRLGRSWDAPPGSALLVSILLRPSGLEPDRLHLVTAAVALAGRDACEAVGGFRPDLKWPNDLLVGDRKLAGILAVAAPGRTGTGRSPYSVVVGMGLNLSVAPEGAVHAAAIAGRPVERDALLEELLTRLEGRLDDWDRVAAAYRRECATVGRRVRVDLAGSTIEGRALEVDRAGQLVVETSAGRVVVSAGDVVHVRPAADAGGAGC